jgi:hypothetical protein
MRHRLRQTLLLALLSASGLLTTGCRDYVRETAAASFASFVTTIVTTGINEALPP